MFATSPARGCLAVSMALTLALSGCASGKGELEGEGGEGGSVVTDARLLADLYTWQCQEGDFGRQYQGVFGQVVSLEYAPDSLRSLDLPGVGDCVAGLDMFPIDAGADGIEIPGLTGAPRWQTPSNEGVLDEVGLGFYRDDVYPGARTCLDVEELLGSGTTLADAGPLTGAGSPKAKPVPDIDYSGLTVDEVTGAQTLDWGAAIDIAWDEHEWEQVWVQIRRERNGEAYESVTCNATGRDGFAIGDEVWGLMTEDLAVEQNNLYVAFQSSKVDELDDGTSIQSTARAMAVALVND
jgi:hypothetical protein